MNEKLQDKKTLKRMRESYNDNHIHKDEYKFTEYKSELCHYIYKYSDELQLNHIKKDLCCLIEPYTFVETIDILINNL